MCALGIAASWQTFYDIIFQHFNVLLITCLVYVYNSFSFYVTTLADNDWKLNNPFYGIKIHVAIIKCHDC